MHEGRSLIFFAFSSFFLGYRLQVQRHSLSVSCNYNTQQWNRRFGCKHILKYYLRLIKTNKYDFSEAF